MTDDLVARLEAWADSDANYGHHGRSSDWRAAKARIEALEAENRKLREVLGDLEASATGVHKRGAVTGPQWFRLAGDLICARAALTDPRHD